MCGMKIQINLKLESEMVAKKIVFDSEARAAIREGIQKLAAAVKITLGPCGRNVLLERPYGPPLSTKDGVTVAREVFLEDSNENMGAQMVKEVASKTANIAGDGTTTATVLAEAIFIEGLKNVTAGANPMLVKKGIDKAVAGIVSYLKEKSTIISSSEQIEQIATCSANHDVEIGKMMAEAMAKVGKDGVVTVEEGKSLETTVDLLEGMQFDNGYISPHFITNTNNSSVELENPLILILEKKISTVKSMVPLLENISKSGRPLFIIAEDVDGEALATLVVNKLRGSLQVVAVKAPAFGDKRRDMLSDIAVLTGGKAIFEDLGIDLEKLDISNLGAAKKVIVTKDSTTIVEGAGTQEAVAERVQSIKNEIELSKSEFNTTKLKERLAKLTGGVAQISVGATTESEMKEKKARVEDALHACRAAVEEGVLPGGGISSLKALDSLEIDCTGDEAIGVEIVKRAVLAPIKQIVKNSGDEGAIVAQNVMASAKFKYGYNALTKEYGDMFKFGIIVPTKVERIALQNGASIAALLLTTDAMISTIKEPEPAQPQMSMGPRMM